jgi:tetratricopeptide (TPR) repeat protein
MANLYDAAGSWAELVDVLERQVDIAASDDDRVNIIARRARIMSDKLQRDDQAAQDWNRILDIDYGNLGALRAIADIRRRQGDPNELVSALHQVVDRAASLLEGDELKEVFRELGKTYSIQLEQLQDAADAWRKLLDIGPDFEAMDALEAIYRADERWTDVIEVKMMRAAALEDVHQQIAEYRGAASLWKDPVGEPDLATGAWQKILDLDPTNDEAFTELEALHTAAGRWEPLIELLLGRLGTRELASEKTLLLRKIARVFEEELDDREQALEALINALEEDFHDRETARYLEKIAQATGKWPLVIERVVGWLKVQTDPAQKIRLCLHLAKWYGEDLGHPEYAQPYYAQIVQLDPNNVGALRQMGQLYRKSANWQQLGATLTRALEVAVTDVDRKEILTELGELLDTQMNQTDQALGYFHRALDVDAQFLPALENLERIYLARGQNRELADVLTRKVPALSDQAEVASTKLRIAALAESSLGDPTRAAQVYREVLEIEPSSLVAMRGLSRIYESLQQWPDLVRILESELDVAPTERERIDLLLQVAALQEEHFLKPDVAAARLEQVLEIDPNHEAALTALERNYRKLRQWNELISAYERHVSTTADRRVKIDLFAAIAQVYADELEDADRAIDAYRNIVDIDETNVPALEALAKLYDRQGETQQ